MKLEGRRALVTGGAVRIGRAISAALAECGVTVVVHYHRSRQAAEELVADLRGRGRAAHAVSGRLWEQDGCERVLADAWGACGGVDFLINNAAVFHKDGLLDADEETILADWRVNCLAPMLLTRGFARLTAGGNERPRTGIVGKVVNLLDRRVAGNETGCLPYLLSKKMLADFTRCAALELAPAITVNAVAPGAVLPPPGKGPDYLADAAGPIPLETLPSPADVASAVLFLLESDSTTGQTLYVDGGQHLL